MSASQVNQGNLNTPHPRVSSTRPVTATAHSQTNQHGSANVGPGPASSPNNRIQTGRSIFGRVRDFFASRPIGHSLLHGCGLKTFSFKKTYEENGKEIPKPVVVRSRLIAFASLDTHLLPALITIFLIGTNAQVLVNGPPITRFPQYVLQGAAKLHELTIVASLARVITDILRYQLLDEGVSFGMLGSPFTFLGLNYLWSQEFFSAVQSAWTKPRLKAHSFLVCVLVLFCILAAVVGPASALLFFPSPAWLSSGSTDFSLIGTENDLWPQNLTRKHAGPPSCLTTNGGNFWCLQGSWDIIQGFVTPEGVSKREVQILDAATARTMWLCRPYVRGDSDSWASTLHGASVYLAERVTQFHQDAWKFAKGTYKSLVNATLFSLPQGLGTSTLGVAFITNNATFSAGCGCAVDMRWAQGRSALHGLSNYWQAFVGDPVLPKASNFETHQDVSFSDPEMQKYLGATLTADEDWIRALNTGYQLKDSTGNFTALEVILVSTRLWDMPWVLNDKVGPTRDLEAVLSVYLVNALSRVGWNSQRDSRQTDATVNPLLFNGSPNSDTLLHANGQIWTQPTDISMQPVRQEWFVYATAWQLNDPVLYVSVVVLGLHLLIVAVHSAIILWNGLSSESWNSVSEIVALAWLSRTEGDVLENCGPGIMLQSELGKKVRVREYGRDKVRLVSVGMEMGQGGDKVKVGKKYG